MEKLNILLAGDQFSEHMFESVLTQLRIKCDIEYRVITDEMINSLLLLEKLPDIIFLSFKDNEIRWDMISRIKQNSEISDIVLALYAENLDNKTREKAFLSGINICMAKDTDQENFTKNIIKIVTWVFLFVTDDLRKKSLILSC